MEIIFKEEKGNLFGSTNLIGIGKRQPKLIYGIKAKELREKAGLTVEELALEFSVKPNLIRKIENHSTPFEAKILNKYLDKFNVDVSDFSDNDLETLILAGDSHIIKSFNSSKECREYFDNIMDDYFNAIANKEKYIFVDFSK